MPINGKDTYYEFFGLPNFEPDMDKIKRAYRSMALKWHPDRHLEADKPNAERMIKQVNEIWSVFSKKKDSYDQYLRRKLQPQDEPAHSYTSADAMGGGWTFDYSSMEEILKRAKNDAWHRQYSDMFQQDMDLVRKSKKINAISDMLRKLDDRQLDMVENFIKMIRG